MFIGEISLLRSPDLPTAVGKPCSNVGNDRANLASLKIVAGIG
jgi:hypothetical protein